jgi:hypothetical protein
MMAEVLGNGYSAFAFNWSFKVEHIGVEEALHEVAADIPQSAAQ